MVKRQDSAEKASPDDEATLARYADALAHVAHFPAESSREVVERLGIAATEWATMAASWSKRLARAAASGQLDLARRFGASFADAAARLRTLDPDLESIGPLRPVQPPTMDFEVVPEEEPANPAAQPDPMPIPEIVVPSFMLDGEARTPTASGAGWAEATEASLRDLDETLLPVPGRSKGLPFAAPAPFERQTLEVSPKSPGEGSDGETMMAVIPDETLAFAPSAASGWTPGRFAKLCAELDVDPSRHAEVLARNGVATSLEWEQLVSYWNEVLPKDPQKRRIFEEHRRAHREYLSGRGRKR